MASLSEQINSDLKKAIKEKQAFELSVLRMLSAAVKNKEIEVIGSEDKDLTDEQVAQVLASEIKKRKDAAETYEQGGRPDLEDKEKREIEILSRYLPAQLSGAEVEKAVRKIVAGAGEAGAKDFGRIMGQAMRELKGKADGGLVGEIVKKILAE